MLMFDGDLKNAIKNRKVFTGRIDYNTNLFPTWDQLVPFLDRAAIGGEKRALDPRKMFCNVNPSDFQIVRDVMVDIGKLIHQAGLTCHCYAGFGPSARASPPHKDPMDVLFVMIKGSMPWKVFENGCDYDDKTQTMTSRSTYAARLVQGNYVYIPSGVYHCAIPDSSRVGFSFGW